MAAAPCSNFTNAGVEHYPLRLNVLSFPQNAIKALQEAGIDYCGEWGLYQMLPAHPDNMLEPGPSPGGDLTQPQLVIS